jgi:4a-hydroxytetrahydrobiopterin dehydratase
MRPLSKSNLPNSLNDFIADLPDWQVSADSKVLSREFIFPDFKSAFQFMSLCANLAEELNHHPDWSNSWNRVAVSLTTHSANALTQLDLTMAKAMDQFSKDVLAG